MAAENWDDAPVVAEVPEIKLFGKWSADEVQVSDISLTVSKYYFYRPHPKDGEGNVLTGVSVHRGRVSPSPVPGPVQGRGTPLSCHSSFPKSCPAGDTPQYTRPLLDKLRLLR